MLEVRDISIAYGKHVAIARVSIEVGKGEMVAILGANGAGKSSLLGAIGGRTKPAGGSVSYDGQDILALPPHEVVEHGIVIVPEGRGIFPQMTVAENLRLGALPRRAEANAGKNLELVHALFPKLAERGNQLAGTMSGGEQQMVAIGRALMSSPKLLLLDEPSLGLAPIVAQEVFAALAKIRETGLTIVIVEQNARATLALADRAYLIETGAITGSGTASELRNDPAVIRAFLGGEKIQKRPNNMTNLDLYIGGKHVAASNNATFERKNPVTGETVTVAAAASVEDATRAVDAAAAAFPAWSETGPAARRKMLTDAATSLNNRADDIVQAMKDEIGATEAWARFNVMLASNMLIEAASLTTQIKGEIIPSNRPGSMAMAIRQPAGVVLAMAPWNAPVILGIRSIATPLACGNTVVMKTSELCPRTHALIIEAVAQGGLPDGVLNAISNAPEDAPALVEAMIANPAVRRVNFTGSTRVGKVIGELAGRYLKPALLELGGKAPMILLEDADIDAAVAAAGFGAYMNQGQICMSTERIIAVGSIGDKFVEAFAKKVEQLTAGDPREGSSPLGSLVDATAAERIKELIEDGVGKGAKLIAGGGEGTILNAAALDHVTPDMRLYTEESFGPVVSIIRAGSVDEAVRIANDSDFGLSSAVFSRDVMQAMNVAKRIESGICHINGPTVHDEAQMPFGGVKSSGYGRFGGNWGIAEFTELRWITIQDGTPHYPI
ncbi:Salicylaldehyde dehydrogenase (Modular protein) [Hoeflea sp. EC-HK425]|nr:Salicylaldehyde dehydrogenase (Modular protein) [Hoeflea sp. EC-HK425]|tara:strand:+ start:122 stop:2299 length:2178 start_codon:yes stop_codon:yes gene_type:complete